MGARNLNHCTTREVPRLDLLLSVVFTLLQAGRDQANWLRVFAIPDPPNQHISGGQALPGRCCLPGLALEQADAILQVNLANLHTRNPLSTGISTVPPRPWQLSSWERWELGAERMRVMCRPPCFQYPAPANTHTNHFLPDNLLNILHVSLGIFIPLINVFPPCPPQYFSLFS